MNTSKKERTGDISIQKSKCSTVGIYLNVLSLSQRAHEQYAHWQQESLHTILRNLICCCKQQPAQLVPPDVTTKLQLLKWCFQAKFVSFFIEEVGKKDNTEQSTASFPHYWSSLVYKNHKEQFLCQLLRMLQCKSAALIPYKTSLKVINLIYGFSYRHIFKTGIASESTIWQFLF